MSMPYKSDARPAQEIAMNWIFKEFTHNIWFAQCGLVMPYGDIDPGQHWLN